MVRVIGSCTSPTMLNVGISMNGSMQAVFGSGTISMSLFWIMRQPRIDDPSNPEPSLNKSNVNSEVGIEKCCQVPMRSTNLTSTISTLFFFAKSNTSFAVIQYLLANTSVYKSNPTLSSPQPLPRTHQRWIRRNV